jgi:hypothetical protein
MNEHDIQDITATLRAIAREINKYVGRQSS